MTVLFVLATFLVFVLIDWYLSRHEVKSVVPAEAEASQEGPDRIDGFLVPERLRYHHGHGWVLRERKHLVRIGIDEFASRIAGKIDKIELPKAGQWIRQGQRAWTVFRQGESVEMVSPIEGEVVEVNADVVKDPSLLRRDPYGQGWLVAVHVPDEEGTSRNLIPRDLVGSWMRQAVEKLYSYQPELAGAVAADAGHPVEDIAEALPGVNWKSMASEFFLTGKE